MSLYNELGQIREKIGRYKGSGINEDETRVALIDPLLRLLGWDTGDRDEVRRGFRLQSNDNPADYALLLQGKPRLFIEAKALGVNLDDNRWSHQIMGYTGVTGVEWIVLTDGNEYRIYYSHAPVPVSEKEFRRFRIEEPNERTIEILPLLSRDSIQKNEMRPLWRSEFVDRTVQEKVKRFFEPEPNPVIVDLIVNQTESLSESEIRDSLRRAHIHFTLSITPIPVRVSAPPSPDAQTIRRQSLTSHNEGMRPDVSLRELIQSGVIKPPAPLEKRYKNRLLVAQIEINGTVTFEGASYDSLSMAGRAARISIIGSGKAANTNGWSFWKFKDSDGQLKEMDVLRQRYRIPSK
ncbi:MAG: hypothetical protein ACR2M3_00280 [Thermomicrobiales bacterium]